MSTVIAVPAAAPLDPLNRRLAGGLLLSLLLHALVLSLQFGIPGLRPGSGAPLTVHLAPLPTRPEPQTLPPVPSAMPPAIPDVPPAALPLPQTSQPVLRSQPGFSLLDPPRPQPAPAPPAVPPARTPRRRARAHAPTVRDGLHTKIIAQDLHKDDSFALPPVASEPAPETDATPKTAVAQVTAEPDTPPAEPVAQAEAEPSATEREARRAQLAAQREQALAARREAEEQALRADAEREARRNADEQARLLAQQAARDNDELANRQREAEEARRRAEQALAQSREEEQRQAAAREQAQRAARELAEQQRIQAEQARAQQLAEQQRMRAEQERAQQLAEQRRVRAEQERAQQLAEQQRLRAEQERAQQQAEQLAHARAEQAEQAERLARQEQARRQRDVGIDAAGPAPATAASGLAGAGGGTGALPRAALESPMATRARELLRGIAIDKPVPDAMRPADNARRDLRWALADAVLRDVPLRMYLDSIRQKIERNAIVSPSQLAADTVRIFPVVSITVRSDGSIEDVTILRSSGRADIDETVRRIVHLNARYAAFPPNVAEHYDVIELRRIWSFAGALRLLEEMR